MGHPEVAGSNPAPGIMSSRANTRDRQGWKKVAISGLAGFIVGIILFLALAVWFYPRIFIAPLSSIFGNLLGILLLVSVAIITIFSMGIILYLLSGKLGWFELYSGIEQYLRLIVFALIGAIDITLLSFLIFYIPTLSDLLGDFSLVVSRLKGETGTIATILTLFSAFLGAGGLKDREERLIQGGFPPKIVYAESAVFVGILVLIVYALVFAAGIKDAELSNTTMVGLLVFSMWYYVFVGVLAPALIRSLSEVYKDEAQEN